jgi:hypothetical protein
LTGEEIRHVMPNGLDRKIGTSPLQMEGFGEP